MKPRWADLPSCRRATTGREAVGFAAASLLVLGLAGCGGGALQQANLVRDCSAADAQCVLTGLEAPIAVGATMRPLLQATASGSAAPELRLLSTREDRIEAAGSVLRAKAPGVAAILLATPEGTVVDFLHLWAVAATRLELHGMTAAGANLGQLGDALELEVGESFYVEPRAYAEAQALLGEPEATWSVEPPLADVLKTGRVGLRRLRAKSAGESALVVRGLGLEARLRLVVHEPLPGNRAGALAATPPAAGIGPCAPGAAPTDLATPAHDAPSPTAKPGGRGPSKPADPEAEVLNPWGKGPAPAPGVPGANLPPGGTWRNPAKPKPKDEGVLDPWRAPPKQPPKGKPPAGDGELVDPFAPRPSRPEVTP